MSIDTQKLRDTAAGAKEFATVGVVKWPITAKSHNGLANAVTTRCAEIDAQEAEIARLRAALVAILEYDSPINIVDTATATERDIFDIARAALAQE